MTHEVIEEREIIDAYLRGRLSPADREAFEEHYFGCDECFAQVKAAESFARGVRQAAESGLLPPFVPARENIFSAWLRPAFALTAAAAGVLGLAVGWMALVQIPRLEREAAAQGSLVEAERQRAATLEQQMAMNRPPDVQPNLSIVMLEASRQASANTVTVPAGANQLALWIEVGPEARSSSFRLEILTRAGEPVETISGLVKNRYGALAAAVPTGKLRTGAYKARLFGADGPMLAEYLLEIRR